MQVEGLFWRLNSSFIRRLKSPLQKNHYIDSKGLVLSKFFLLLFFISFYKLDAMEYICKEFNPSKFKLSIEYSRDSDSEMLTPKKDIKKIRQYIKNSKTDIDKFILCFDKKNQKDEENTGSVSIYINKKGHQYSTLMDCFIEDDEDFNKSVYICPIECDGGGLYIDKNFNMRLYDGGLYIERALDISAPYFVIDISIQQNKKEYLKPIKDANPKLYKISMKWVDSDKYKSKKGLYICYSYKDNGKYEGCGEYNRDCQDIGLMHFGHYPNIQEAKKALNRCKHSKPKKDYVDNPRGKFVCYDEIDDFGVYQGCFRSKKSCKLINKKRFGKYLNRDEVFKGYLRCVNSMPFYKR